MEIIGKNITTLIHPDLLAAAEDEEIQAKRGRFDFLWILSCHLVYLAITTWNIARGVGDVMAWLASISLLSPIFSIGIYRGWVTWRVHKDMQDMYATLAQDPNVMVIMGQRIIRTDPSEFGKRREFESDDSSHDGRGDIRREAGGYDARSDVPVVPADDH